MTRKLYYFIGQLLFIPHVILFLTTSQKEIIITDVYAGKTIKTGAINQLNDLTRSLLLSNYFRTLFYFRTKNSFLSKVLRVFYPKNDSFIIDNTTPIGTGLHLAHPYATIINANAVGDNVYINHLVTIGEKNGLRPTIGNRVQLHAACMVIGGINIGDDAIIGAGAVVVKDVPPNSIVVGNPSRIIERKK
ncbi:serine acetyltransferase [Flavobacterium sp.]|uniref:serine acetyltransferase n=1 Tax=Flavobacterium sp. TaxID=239 RepID=UPI003753201E